MRDGDLIYLTTNWLDASFSSETDVNTFYYTATYDGGHEVVTQTDDGYNPDTVVEVYDSEGNFIGYNDDYGNYDSRFTFTAVAGETYTIYVYEYGNWPGGSTGNEGIGEGGGELGDYRIRIVLD